MSKLRLIGSNHRYVLIVLMSIVGYFLSSNLLYAEVTVGKQPVKGTCEDVNNYREKTGTTDKNGAGHPGYAGWTDSDVRYNYDTPDYAGYENKSNKDMELCTKNNKAYGTMKACTSECKAGKCKVVPPGKVCVNETFASIQKPFSIINSPKILEWSPSGELSKACRAEKDRWEKTSASHEMRHVSDNNKIIERFNKSWSAVPHEYWECSDTQEGAEEIIKKKISDYFDTKVKEIESEIRSAADKYHASINSKIDDMDCSKCKSKGRTYCGCKNPSQGKPRNYSTEAECAVKCPTGLACFATRCTTPP